MRLRCTGREVAPNFRSIPSHTNEHMILTCPSCATRYRADPAKLSGQGRNVRCAKCGHVWFQPAAEPESVPVVLGTGPGNSYGSPTLGDIVTERKLAVDSEPTEPSAAPQTRRRGRTLATVLATIILFAILAGAGWAAVQYRQVIVRLWPESARFYSAAGLPVNLTGIAIRNVGLRQQVQDGMPILSVTGTIVNVSNRDQPIPKLRAILFDESRRELYRWTFDAGIMTLSPGGSKNFGANLPNPPPDARTVNVSLAGEDSQ